jgi:cytochrome c
MKIYPLLLLAGSVWVSPLVHGDEALARAKGCLGCHAVDRQIVGPAYKDVARKYAGQNVADALAQKVMKGGGGVWGPMSMPPNAVTPEEARKLVDWVLVQQ